MPLGLNRSGEYKNGFPITLPHTFGNPVTLPKTFGNPVTLPKDFGNDVTWTPSSAHFGNPGQSWTVQVTGISPIAGSPAGGGTATITGAGFIEGMVVLFGTTEATHVVIVDSEHLTCKIPAHAAGAVNVWVFDPQMYQNGITTYTYNAAPTFASIFPPNGPASGGSLVLITGNNFVTGATVKIGGVPATSVAFVDAQHLTAVTPAGTVGTADVKITNLDTQSVTGHNAFTYDAVPTFTSISPTSGPAGGGTSITSIVGTNFVTGVVVTIGGADCTGTATVSPDGTTITGLSTPAGTTGAQDVVITNPDGGTVTASGAFTYASAAPTLIANGTAQSSGTTAVTSGLKTAGASLLIAITCAYTNYFNSVSDTIGGVPTGNVWVQVPNTNSSSGYGYGVPQIFYVVNPVVSSGADHVFTAKNNGSTGISIAVMAWSGIDTTSPYKSESDSAVYYSGTSIQATAGVTPNAANDLIICAITGYGWSGQPSSFAVDSSVTKLDNVISSDDGEWVTDGYLVAPDTSSVNPTWTLGDSNYSRCYCMNVVFAHA